MGASISANHGSHCFINSKGRDNPPTHNSNSHLHTHLHTPSPSTTCWPLTAPHGHTTSYWLCHFPAPNPNQIYIPRTILPLTYFIHLPMKVEPTVSSEMSAIRTQTPGNYPKRNKLHLEHGESLTPIRNLVHFFKRKSAKFCFIFH